MEASYHNRIVSLKRAKRTYNEAITLNSEGNVGSGVDRYVQEEIYGVKLELAGVKKDMWRINAEVGSMCPKLFGLTEIVERLVKSLVEFQGQCTSIVITRLIDNEHMKNPKKVG